MRRKLLLISSNRLSRPYPIPPLGLALIAESVSRSLDFEVRLFDAMFRSPDELGPEIEGFRPDYVGLSIRNLDEMNFLSPVAFVDDVIESFAKPIRSLSAAPLILGGAGFSIAPRAILELCDGDVGVVGEGEATVVELLERMEGNRPIADMPSVVSREAGIASTQYSPRSTPARIRASKLYRWLDFQRYRARGAYPVQTKRGCPHRCVYCTYPALEGRSYRIRRPEAIAREIEAASEALGPVTFEFVDSIFNEPAGHAESICRAIIDRRLDVSLRTMGINPRGVTGELLELMKRAGFTQMDCTPDSAAPTVLEQLSKGFDRQQLEAAARRIRRAGIPCMWFFVFGGSRETEDTFEQTLDFIDRFISGDDMVYMAAGLRVYPRTPLYRLARAEGVIAETDDLVVPTFYVPAEISLERCVELIEDACATRPNCVPAWETTPEPGILERALELRAQLGSKMPMFKLLISARRELMRTP